MLYRMEDGLLIFIQLMASFPKLTAAPSGIRKVISGMASPLMTIDLSIDTCNRRLPDPFLHFHLLRDSELDVRRKDHIRNTCRLWFFPSYGDMRRQLQCSRCCGFPV